MFDVMIIDDDQKIREWLRRIIDWEALELRLSCEAGDSETARELFLLYRPKIVITDVMLPVVSGLELAREFSALDSDVRFIVITGYNDFGSIKDSVKLGAVDLLSKPILREDINQSLGRVVSYFEALRRSRASSQALTELLEENRTTLLEKYLTVLLKTPPQRLPPDTWPRLEKLGFSLRHRSCTIVLITPELAGKAWRDAELLLAATKNMADELLSDAGFECHSYFGDDSTLICLLGWEEECGGRLEGAVNKLYDKMTFYFDTRIYAGIAAAKTDCSLLPSAYREAQLALNYGTLPDGGSVVAYENLCRLSPQTLPDTDALLRLSVASFKNNRYEELCRRLGGYFCSLDPAAAGYLSDAKGFAFSYTSAIMMACPFSDDGANAMTFSELLARISSANNGPSILAALCETSAHLMEKLSRKRLDNRNFLIETAKRFIQENLHRENLNLETVSEHIGLSSAYFCNLFHREVGVSFSSYMNLQRVERAKQLLCETTLKIFEVSFAVGYSSPTHFNYTFKRLMGMTPLEYKSVTADTIASQS